MRTACCVAVHPVLGLLLLGACGGPPTLALPTTADGAANLFVAQLRAGNPHVVWDLLPPTYRKDLTELVHAFGAKLDAELLASSFAALDKAVTLMQSRKDWILEGLQLHGGGHPIAAKLPRHWDAVLGLGKALADSGLREPAKLPSLDVSRFLAGPGTAILRAFQAVGPLLEHDPFARLGSMTFTAPPAANGETAVQLLVDGKPDGRPERFVRVEGHWLVADMVKDWPGMMTEARQGIAGLDFAKGKPEALAALAEVHAALDRLQAAKDWQEFQRELTAALQRTGGLEGLLGWLR